MVLEVKERVDDSIDLLDAGAHAVDTGALGRLPVQVMKRILFNVDADTFSSLTVLNQKWRKVSEDPEIYAHHLVKCHIFAAFNDINFESMKTRDLAELKRMFRREIRRNAFQIFLRPCRTLLNLISSSVGSSAALPTGEALKFEFSANGHILLCLSSSRIFVLDLTAAEIKVLYELKTSRMPLAATILDDGRVLAVSSSRHQVNIYRLSKDEAVHVQALTLNDVPRALALAPNGTVLAIGYDGSIEVHALGEDAVALQCRAVRCGRIDTLLFSHDGSMLLGSSLDSPDVGFVTVNAPFPTDSMVDLSNQEAHMWTTQVLFPDQMQGFGHVTLLPGRMSGDDDWLVGFDKNLKTFRTVCPREHKLGSTYFAAPPSSLSGCEDYMPCLSPAVDPECEVLALAFRCGGLFIYGLPDDFNATPIDSTGSTVPHASEGHDRSVASRPEKDINQPSLIVEGRKIADIPGLTAARWVGRSRGEDQNISRRQRLVAVAPGGVTSSSLGHEAIPLDGGRICIFDFRIAASAGKTVEKTIELGVEVPLLLREPDANLEQEVELERRRTQLRRNASTRPGLDRRALVDTAAIPPMPDVARQNSRSPDLPALEPAAEDVTLFLDGPYSNTTPRSRVTLQRAATAAASNRRAQHVAREQERSRLPTLQIPHESDADNWVPPPPPYTPDPDQPLPEHLRQLLLPTMTAPPGGSMDQRPQQLRRASTNEADGPENQGSRGSGLISRRWSTRRRTADATDNNTVGALLSFRPFSFNRLSSTDAQQEASSLNNRLPPENSRVSSEEIRISRQRNEDSQITDSTRPVSLGVPKRQSRNSRILGTFRRSTSHGSVASQSNDGGQSLSLTDSRTRRKPVMCNGRFSRSSPNLVSGGNTTINRMSTIHSNASRSVEQNGGIQRSRSRSEAAQPPAPLTEEALEHAVAMQNSRLTPGHNEQALQTTIPQQQQQQPPPPVQESTAAENAYWQQPNMTESDEWRARIEAWNMETINERRKSRGKSARCVVM